jgi:hypothetical protein
MYLACLLRVLLLGSILHVHLLHLLQNRLVWSCGCVGLRCLTWQLGLDRSELFRPVSSKDSWNKDLQGKFYAKVQRVPTPFEFIVWDCYSSYLLSINIFLTTVLWVIIFFTSHLSPPLRGWAKKFFGLLPKNRRIRFRRGRQRLLISGVPVHQSLGVSILLSNFEGVVESVSKALKHSRTKRRQIYESRGKTSDAWINKKEEMLREPDSPVLHQILGQQYKLCQSAVQIPILQHA